MQKLYNVILTSFINDEYISEHHKLVAVESDFNIAIIKAIERINEKAFHNKAGELEPFELKKIKYLDRKVKERVYESYDVVIQEITIGENIPEWDFNSCNYDLMKNGLVWRLKNSDLQTLFYNNVQELYHKQSYQASDQFIDDMFKALLQDPVNGCEKIFAKSICS